MKRIRIGLLTLAALVLAAPLMAEEMMAEGISAPESHWSASPEMPTSVVNWPRLVGDEQELAQAGAPAQESGSPETQRSQQPSPESPSNPSATQPETPSAPQPDTAKHQTAEKQIKEQEQQRVLGVVPSFNVSYRSDAVSLTGLQKIRLAFRTSIDPVTFGVAFVVAGYHEALNDVGFGWGIKGYGQRAGAAYLDTFDGNMIGNGILPALLHQDPRYFRLGRGTVRHRLLYATSMAFICKHDNTGKWEPNYSNIAGNIASGALSNLYYPNSNSGVGLTISNGMIQTAEGAIGSVFQEFWPDISRKLLHKDPTHGQDAADLTGNPATVRP